MSPKAKGRNSRQNATKPGLASRIRAAALLRTVVEDQKPLDDAFAGGTSDADSASAADRALTQALTLTALRHLPRLDHAINACLDKPLKGRALKIRPILQIMAVQVLVLDMAEHAAISLAVDDTARNPKNRPFKGLVNAVGRTMIRNKSELKKGMPVHGIPKWLSDRWRQSYGAETIISVGQALLDQPAIDLSLKDNASAEPYTDALADFDPITLDQTTLRLAKPGGVTRLPGYAKGDWWVQDYAASLPAKGLLDLMGNPAGKTVLDLCAAPGGKTAQLAAAGCYVTAVDQSKKRMQRLSENLNRLHLSVETIVGDASTITRPDAFDAVLLDAPCSATGTLRRNPDIAYVRTAEDIKALTDLQAKLLRHATSLVKPGGILAYATCSLEPAEGEDQISAFLGEHPNWQTVLPASFSEQMTTFTTENGLRTLPHYNPPQQSEAIGMDGFFMTWLKAPV